MSASTEEDTSRFSRQSGLVPKDVIDATAASVIGVGAIGRNVAVQLAAIGLPSMHIFDPDRVDMTNITTQGFFNEDYGNSKVSCVQSFISNIDPNIKVTGIDDRYRQIYRLGQVVFCCVDSITDRAFIWEAAKDQCKLFIDGRMQGETIRILVADSDNISSKIKYEDTLFVQEEAQEGNCTAKSTIYAANIAAGLMVHQFTRWLRKFPTEEDSLINLLSSEWITDVGAEVGHEEKETEVDLNTA